MKKSATGLIILLGVILSICAGCTSKPALVQVSGKIINPYLEDKPSIEGVEVSVSGNPELKATTDTSGDFSLEIPAKKNSSLTLSFTKTNYAIADATVTIDESGQPNMPAEITGGIIFTSPIATSYIASPAPFKSSNARFFCFSPDGEYLYYSEPGSRGNSFVKRWRVGTDEFIILAGGGYGRKDASESYSGDKTEFSRPEGIAISSDGDTIYVADYMRIRKITGVKEATSASDVTVYTIAGGGKEKRGSGVPGIDAELRFVTGIELADNDNTLYICGETSVVWKLSNVKEAKNGEETVASCLAGTFYSKIRLKDKSFKDGPLKEALLSEPRDIELTADEDTMYVADGNLVRKITGLKSDNPTISTIAGNYGKAGKDDDFEQITCLILSKDEDTLFVSDGRQGKIKKITSVKSASNRKDVKITELSGITTNKLHSEPDNKLYFRGAAGIILNPENTVMYAYDISHKVRQLVASEDKK